MVFWQSEKCVNVDVRVSNIDVSKQTILKTAIFEYQFIIANISMTVRRIVWKIRRFIEIRCLFILFVEFYLYPTVGTVLIHSVKPELTE